MNEIKKRPYRCKGEKVFQEGELVGRKDCGSDLIELIEAVPEDGKTHTIKCRSCGNQAKVARVPE